MTESKHTPGPWEVTEAKGPDGKHCYWYVDPVLPEDSDFIGSIASFCSSEHIGGISPEANRANADLTSAAPDLLEALKANVEAMEAFGITGGALDASRAAIAKAEGQS